MRIDVDARTITTRCHDCCRRTVIGVAREYATRVRGGYRNDVPTAGGMEVGNTSAAVAGRYDDYDTPADYVVDRLLERWCAVARQPCPKTHVENPGGRWIWRSAGNSNTGGPSYSVDDIVRVTAAAT